MRLQVWSWSTLLQNTISFGRMDRVLGIADKFDTAQQFESVDHDFDFISLAHFANRASCQRLRRDVTDTGACRYPAESGIGQNCDVLAMWKGFQCRCDLIYLLHACALWSAANQNY